MSTITAFYEEGKRIPRGITPKPGMVQFRLIDADGELCAEGVSVEGGHFEPLDQWQEVLGCTTIEWLIDGKWEAL